MIRTTCLLLPVIALLGGCAALQTEETAREIVIGDCQNGAVMTQATFGGPLRCGPQSEPVFTEITPAPES